MTYFDFHWLPQSLIKTPSTFAEFMNFNMSLTSKYDMAPPWQKDPRYDKVPIRGGSSTGKS